MGQWILSRNNITILKDYSLAIDMLMTINMETLVHEHKPVEPYKAYSAAQWYQKTTPKEKWNSIKGKYEFVDEQEEDFGYATAVSYLPNPNKNRSETNTFIPINGALETLGKKNENYTNNTPSLHGYIRGDLIAFFPMDKKTQGNSSYLEGYFEPTDVTMEDIEVRYYTGDSKALNYLKNRVSLVGKIIAIGMSAGKRFFVVDPPVVGVLSKNNILLLQSELPTISTKCWSCDGVANKGIPALKRSNVYIDPKSKKPQLCCPDCTEYLEEQTRKSSTGVH
jgi:hypothetical protein